MKDWHLYFMDFLPLIAQRSSCVRHCIGAILVKERNIVATGYNGTPHGIRNCNDGGCIRCNSDVPANIGYDFCACLHAEENVLLLSAQYGVSVIGCDLYTTFRPCIGCLRIIIQCQINIVYYGGDWNFRYEDEQLELFYQNLLIQSNLKMYWVKTDEPA